MAVKPTPLRDRFFRFVHHEPNTGCWLWGGAASHCGGRQTYGVASEMPRETGDKPRAVSAHRASWIIHNGPIPSGLLVCHHCDVKLCVNPSHMFLGTHRDNTADMATKGRGNYVATKGSASHFASLSDDDVIAIRSINRSHATYRGPRRGRPCVTHRELARSFNCSPGTVLAVLRHRTWAHL